MRQTLPSLSPSNPPKTISSLILINPLRAGKSPKWRVTDIYTTGPLLAFKLMHRAVGFTEIADDPHLLRKTRNFYHRFEKNTSSAHIVFPWLITPSYIVQGLLAGRMWLDMYRLLSSRRRRRRQQQQPQQDQPHGGTNDNGEHYYDDAIQVLLEKGNLSNDDIIQFVFFLFIAGLGTTSFGVSWMLILLARHPTWQAKCREEVRRAIIQQRSRINANTPVQKQQQQSDSDVLATFTLQHWEGAAGNGFPVLAACLKEALRLLLPGAMFRKNISGRDITTPSPTPSSGSGGRGEREQQQLVIPADSYAVYSVADIHMDERVYPDADSYDPSRWLDEDDSRRGGQEPHTYLAWGSGRHACGEYNHSLPLSRSLIPVSSNSLSFSFFFFGDLWN